jgi:long-chain acyl-CoA synthetase
MNRPVQQRRRRPQPTQFCGNHQMSYRTALSSSVQNVAEFLLAGKPTNATALSTLEGEYSYGDLSKAQNDVARYLLETGARAGDRVLLLAENNFFWVAAYLGILRAGMVCVPLAPTISAEDLTHVISVTSPAAAFAQLNIAAKHASLWSFPVVVDVEPSSAVKFDGVLTFGRIRELRFDSPTLLPETRATDLAALMFTSGSTGKPRGVMVSHGNIVANTRSITHYLQLTEKDKLMTVLPFHYCFGTSLLHTHLHAGGTLVIDRRFLFPEKVLQRMYETECTGFAGVPSHYQILLRRSGLKSMSFPYLRYVQQAGGQLAPALITELRKALPNTQIFIMYGQTEATARLSYLPPDMLDSKLGSIGKGIPGVRLQVLNEAGEAVLPGQVGEIVAEGDNVAVGYWHSENDVDSCFRNGKLYTGDLATIDEDGFIYVVDRAKDIIKCGGKRISSRQIEETLMEFSGLLEAGVIGIPDEILGEAVKAFVVPKDKDAVGLEAQLRAFCKDKMPAALIPKEIVLMSALPKNSAGKVLKSALKNA